MQEVTKEEMAVLIRLQTNEDEKNKIQSLLNTIPREISGIDEQLADREKQVRDREVAWEERKKKYRDFESEIKLKQENIRKSDQKLMSIKSNKEYQAVLTEIEDMKRQIGKMEDEMLNLLFDLEEEEKVLAAERKEWEAEKDDLEEEKRSLEEKRGDEEQALSALNDDWQKIAESMPRPLLNQYLEVRDRVLGGKAVAQVRDYVCQGCFMNIPAQMYNELHSTNTLRFCPFCNRIIFVNGNKEQ